MGFVGIRRLPSHRSSAFRIDSSNRMLALASLALRSISATSWRRRRKVGTICRCQLSHAFVCSVLRRRELVQPVGACLTCFRLLPISSTPVHIPTNLMHPSDHAGGPRSLRPRGARGRAPPPVRDRGSRTPPRLAREGAVVVDAGRTWPVRGGIASPDLVANLHRIPSRSSLLHKTASYIWD